jgi:UDP-N-acetylglucosamine 2-epimerase (non-hydrolysing)
MKNIFILIGTRPNFIKVTRFKALAKSMNVKISLIHTGQHYDKNMADVFFEQFDLKPDYFLSVGGLTPIAQVASILLKLEALFIETGKPDLLIVPGDVNSTLAGAIAANKMDIKLAHLESGLRSFDKKMPEEHNRVVVDNLSDICFVTEESGIKNLNNEGVNADVVLVGNTMIDTLVYYDKDIEKSNILKDLGIDNKKFILLTFHRPSNVDNKESLLDLIVLLERLSLFGELVLPLHPRTTASLESFELLERLNNISNIHLIEPLGYFEFQKLIKYSTVVITDSGGIQEETTYRKVPCLTVRDNTERPITISEGTNTLVGTDFVLIHDLVQRIFDGNYKEGKIPELWDGDATKRILETIR